MTRQRFQHDLFPMGKSQRDAASPARLERSCVHGIDARIDEASGWTVEVDGCGCFVIAEALFV